MSQVEDQKKALKNKITNVAEKVSDEKYYVEGEDYEMMARRVGGFIGAAEDSIDNMKYWGNEFTNLIQAKKLIPAGRILANAGTYFELLNDKQREYLKDYIEKYHPHELRCGQMLNCYVLPVEDSKHGPGSIYESLEDAADITAMEGGVGENFSNLRPAGSPIRGNPKYKSSGPLAFMNIYNASSVGMKQGGGRRGANMAILDCDHPDIFEFIHCKDDENKMTNYNISVGIYDSFMEACEKDTMWSLQFGGKEYDKVPARKLLRELSHHAWEKVSKGGGGGEPGFVFLDNAAKTWPFPKVKPKATNPCVTADTWVMTSEGPRMVRDLIGTPFKARVHGCHYDTISEGFWKTGKKDVYLLETHEGHSLKLTEDHEVYSADSDKIKAKDLVEGQPIMLDHAQKNISWNGGGSFEEGYLIGMLVGDGTFMGGPNKKNAVLSTWYGQNEEDVTSGVRKVMDYIENIMENMPHRSDWTSWKKCTDRNEYRISHMALTMLADKYGIIPNEKMIGEKIEMASSEFQKGFLSGFFDADGTVQSIAEGSHNNEVRLPQSNMRRLVTVQRMLHRFGIISKIYQDRQNTGDITVGGKLYEAQHELSISKSNVIRFSEAIGFIDSDKQMKLDNAIESWTKGPYREKYVTRFKSLTKIGCEDVYDVTIDKIHKFNANGMIISNCGEQFLDPYEACCLAAMNLYAYIYFIDGVAKFDMHQFKLDIYKAIRFLDNVLDLNNYPLKYRNDICRDISMRHRRIGLGIMGLADVLMVLGFGYDTDQALGWVDMVMGEFAKAAHGSSVQLAHEKSPFIDHMEAREEFQNRRNCAVTTIAPTGTTSMIIGVNGGCEPFYGLVMQKNTTDGSGNVYYMVSEQFRYLCDRFGVELTEARLEQIYKNRGSVQGLDWVPEGVKKVARTTMDIDAAAHVKMQCVLQKHIENSISKTVNLPKEATVEDVENSIFALWRGGAKGGTIYRDGSRDLQILNVGSNTATKEPASVDEIDMENRPDVLHGNTHRVKANLLHGPENAYVTINELKGKPVEVFIHAANEQQMDSFLDFLMHNGVRPDVAQLILSKVSQMAKDNLGLTTRMVSLALRYNVPLVAVIRQLRKININDLYSLHKKLAHILAGYLESETPYDICQNLVDGEKCGGTLVFQESCLRCIKCYDSKCS